MRVKKALAALSPSGPCLPLDPFGGAHPLRQTQDSPRSADAGAANAPRPSAAQEETRPETENGRAELSIVPGTPPRACPEPIEEARPALEPIVHHAREPGRILLDISSPVSIRSGLHRPRRTQGPDNRLAQQVKGWLPRSR